jgi:hypothetical protein
MRPRTYDLTEATAKVGYSSTGTFRKKYLDTDDKREKLGHHYGARGEVRLQADAVDELAEREKEARRRRGNWRSANLGPWLGNAHRNRKKQTPPA